VRTPAVIVAMLLCISAGSASSQQIYRWVDANGRVQITTEKPPAGVKSSTVEPPLSSYGGTPTVSGAPRAAASGAAPAEIKMYATDWCPYCRKAREFFARRGIRYTELDIEKSPAARAEYDRLGARGVPVILVGTQRMNGFGEERLARMLKAAGH
jgi:glutaredoxin